MFNISMGFHLTKISLNQGSLDLKIYTVNLATNVTAKFEF